MGESALINCRQYSELLLQNLSDINTGHISELNSRKFFPAGLCKCYSVMNLVRLFLWRTSEYVTAWMQTI